MYYSMKFTAEGLNDHKTADMLRAYLKSLDGVWEVQVKGPSSFYITYDPIQVIPSRIMSILSSAGYKKG